jgi:hypothetical protein
MEDRIVIDLTNTTATFIQIRGFILSQNLMGKYVEIKTNDATIGGLVASLMGNMNKVLIINGTVIKSFDSLYVVGDTVGWFADYKLITF